VKSKDKLRHNSKVPSASSQSPEQIGILRLGCLYNFSRGGDYGCAEEVVDGEAVLSAKPAKTTTESKTARPGIRINLITGTKINLPA
jgi:hypothetical protein